MTMHITVAISYVFGADDQSFSAYYIQQWWEQFEHKTSNYFLSDCAICRIEAQLKFAFLFSIHILSLALSNLDF